MVNILECSSVLLIYHIYKSQKFPAFYLSEKLPGRISLHQLEVVVEVLRRNTGAKSNSKVAFPRQMYTLFGYSILIPMEFRGSLNRW